MLLTISGINERTMVTVRVNSLVYAEGPVGYVNAAISWRVNNAKFAIPSDQLDQVSIEFGELMEESVYKRVMEKSCLPA